MPHAGLRHLNWSGCQVVTIETTPRTFALDGIVGVQVEDEDTIVSFVADGGKFASLKAARDGRRSITFMGQNCAILADLPKAIPCTVTAILNHPVAGAGAASGAVQFVLGPSIIAGNGTDGSINKPAEGRARFEGYATDGTTDPLVKTVL